MAKNRMAELAIAAALIAALGGTAFAQADAIAARQAIMKGIGGKMAAVRGADPAAAKAAAVDVNNAMKTFGTLFPAGSGPSSGKTRAKEEIWTDAAGFKAALDKAQAAAGGLVSATNSGDAAQVTAAAGAMMQTCGGCHTPYRGPPVP